MKSRSPLRTLVAAALAAVAVATLLAACGNDDDDSNSTSAGNGTDLTFIDEMIAHHEGAIEMAELAQEHGQSRFVKELADDVIEAQQAEITVMQRIRNNLEGRVEPEDLAIADDMMGMNMDIDALASADPFDREFVDMMIAHHQGAIRMARAELTAGESEALKQLAQDVDSAQTREIQEMNEFRERTYGERSPSGGVPPEDEPARDPSDDMNDMDGMGH